MKRKTESGVIAALLVVGFFGGLMGGAAGDQEPNDDFSQAESVSPGDHSGGLTDLDRHDFYKFTMEEGQRYIINCSATQGSDLKFTVYDPNQEYIDDTELLAAPNWEVLEYTLGHANAGNYYIDVETIVSHPSASYSFNLQIIDQSDAGQTGDAGDTDATARPIQPGIYGGWLRNEDKKDYYSFMVPHGNKILLNLTTGSNVPSSGSMRVQLYDPNKEYVDSTDWKYADLSGTIIRQTSDVTGGTYYAQVEYSSKGGNYTLALELIPENDAGSGTDVSGSMDRTPMALTGPGTYEGYLLDDDKNDYYSFDVPNGSKLILKLTTGSNVPSGGSLRLQVYSPDKNYLNSTDWKYADLSDTIYHQTSDTTGGTYYAQVEYSSKGGNYTLALELIPENDAGSGSDAPGDINANPLLLPGNGTYEGYIHDDDKSDWYKFNVSNGQIIMYNLSCGLAEPDTVRFNMYRPNKENYQTSEWLNPGVSQNELGWITNNAGAGQWYLEVEGDNTYSFQLTLLDQSDAGELGDAGDDINTPRPVQVGENYTGLEGDDDEADYYSFDASIGERISIGFVITSGSDEGQLHLLGPDKNEIDSTPWVSPNVSAALGHTVAAAGTHYIHIATGNNEYIFNITRLTAVNDTEAPGITVTSPANGSTVYNATIDVTGTASDNIGVAKVELSLSGIIWWLATGTTTWTYHNLTLGNGSNTIYVRATDQSGNTNTTSILVTYSTAPADTTKPNITLMTPKPGAKVTKKTIRINGVATDDSGLVEEVEVRVNGVKATSVLSVLGAFGGNVTLKEGKNTILITARDAAGNEATMSLTVTYEKPKPQPGFEALLLLVAVGAGAALLRKRRG